MTKNCGDSVLVQIIERDILHEMVKIVKKKPDLNVREKILVLLDAWQEAFGGPSGKYPQFYAAYQELKNAGVEYPPRMANAGPLFTPLQNHPRVTLLHSSGGEMFEGGVIGTGLQSDASDISMAEIQNARSVADILMEMLNALDPSNTEGVKEELIVDLVEQCKAYQKQVMLLVNSTSDEELLSQGLMLNDELQCVLCKHDGLLKGSSINGEQILTSKPLVNVDHEEDESEDDLAHLTHRSSRENAQGQSRRPVNVKNEPVAISPLLPPPSSLHKVLLPAQSPQKVGRSGRTTDYLSGDVYESKAPEQPQQSEPTSTPSVPTQNLSSQPWKEERSEDAFQFSPFKREMHGQDESFKTGDSSAKTPATSSEVPTTSLPPPPSKYNQRQQFFEQHQQGLPEGTSNNAVRLGHSYDGLIGRTQNLSLNLEDDSSSKEAQYSSGTKNLSQPAKQMKPEDKIFKDLFDFAKAKSSPSAKPGSL
ncbi:TOM1-like protein 2 isoform X2 [Amborella trichopoda]|nr:TOM1-like protein 2 isoform X2 [Amborella trichopoda]|eukprot:XP_020529618.1 TOM1-like protein 2 isoform X2 [Amborella trichopoda]